MTDSEGVKFFLAMLKFIAITLCVCIASCSWIQPHYSVWQQSMQGKAELAHAEYNRQIATCEANAKKESAKALADAEVIRAEGMAKANKIIGGSLEGNEGYLRYLWIQGLQTKSSQVIYVPTEANLPILESQRLNNEK
jgi:hypothetical protein